MRRCLLLCLAAAAFLALTSAESSKEPIFNAGEPPHVPPNLCYHAGELARVNTLFGAALYKTLAAASSTLNIVTSPFAISAGLSMTYAGAQGLTREQMGKTLKFSTMPTNCNQHIGFRCLLSEYTSPRKSLSFKIAIRVFIERHFGVKMGYAELVSKNYPVTPMRLPFQSSPAQSLAAINNWVSTATDGKFTEVMHPSVVTSDTKLVLVNVIGFKARWQHEFPPWRTRRARFHKSPTKHVDMMHTSIDSPLLLYATLRSIRAKIVELPYHNSLVSMYIVVPFWHNTLAALERDFNWNPDKIRMTYRRMAVALPRFSVHQHVQLDPYLKRMGMTNPFTAAADFSRIDGQRDLKIDGVVHEAVLNVTETGTEVGVASTISKARGAHRYRDGYVFVANRPFLFFIYDFGTKTVLFTGRFLK